MSADLPAGMTVNFDKGGKSVKVKDLDTIYFDRGRDETEDDDASTPHVCIMSL